MTLFDGNTVDYLIEHDEYKYYFDSQFTLDNMSKCSNVSHLHLCRYATEIYSKKTGRCVKHRFYDATVINTAMRRAGHVDI